MIVLMVLLLGLKLVQSGVYHPCGGGHDIVCTTFFIEPPTKFFKKGEEHDRISIFKGDLLGKRG